MPPKPKPKAKPNARKVTQIERAQKNLGEAHDWLGKITIADAESHGAIEPIMELRDLFAEGVGRMNELVALFKGDKPKPPPEPEPEPEPAEV